LLQLLEKRGDPKKKKGRGKREGKGPTFPRGPRGGDPQKGRRKRTEGGKGNRVRKGTTLSFFGPEREDFGGF